MKFKSLKIRNRADLLNLFNTKSLINLSKWSVVLKILNVLFNLSISLFLARSLGPDEYGVYVFVLSVITLLGIPIHFGVPNLLIREVARYHLQHEWGKLKGIIKFSNIFCVITTSIVLIFSIVYINLFYENTNNSSFVFYSGLIVLPLIGMNRLREAVLQGLRYVVIAQIPEKIIQPLFFLITIFIFRYYIELSALISMILYAFAALFSFLIGVLLLLKKIPKESYKYQSVYCKNQWFKSIIPLALISGLNVICCQTDIFMLGIFLSSDQVALYRVAFSGAALVIFTLTAGNAVISPYFSRFHNSNDIDKLQSLALKSARVNFIIALPIVFVLIVFGETLLSLLYGHIYIKSYTTMCILSISQLVNVSTGSVSVILTMTGHEKVTLYASIISTLINVLLNYFFIQIYGIEGAACATGISIIFSNICLAYILWKKTSVVSFVIAK